MAGQDVAESGYWLDDMRVGLEDLRDGKLESAMITMALMAERGWALAQANAAYLIERKMGYRYVNRDPLIWRSPILMSPSTKRVVSAATSSSSYNHVDTNMISRHICLHALNRGCIVYVRQLR